MLKSLPVSRAAGLSSVTLRAPEGREVTICVSGTDGSVTTGGNTWIVRYGVLTFVSLFAFSPS